MIFASHNTLLSCVYAHIVERLQLKCISTLLIHRVHIPEHNFRESAISHWIGEETQPELPK